MKIKLLHTIKNLHAMLYESSLDSIHINLSVSTVKTMNRRQKVSVAKRDGAKTWQR